MTFTLEGVPGYEEFTAGLSGPFRYRKDASLPDYDLQIGARDYGVELTSVAGESYVSLGTTGYALPANVRRRLVRSSAKGRNGLTRTLEQFGIAPWRWEADRVAAGTGRLDGVEVQHVTTGAHVGRILRDANTLLGFMRSLGITRAIGLPPEIGPRARRAIVRSVTKFAGESWVGTKDGVLRRSGFTMDFAVPKSRQAAVGGITGGHVVGRLNVTQVGKRQRDRARRRRSGRSPISPPGSTRSATPRTRAEGSRRAADHHGPVPTAFATSNELDRDELLAAPLHWPRPSALDVALKVTPAKSAEAAETLGLRTVGDLLEHLPRDSREARTVATLSSGDVATVVVEVRSITSRPVRRRGMKPLVEATVADETGLMKATFFNQPWLQRKYPPGTRLVLHGTYAARNAFRVSSHAPDRRAHRRRRRDRALPGDRGPVVDPDPRARPRAPARRRARRRRAAGPPARTPARCPTGPPRSPAPTPTITRAGGDGWRSTSCCSRSYRCCAAARSGAGRARRGCSTVPRR